MRSSILFLTALFTASHGVAQQPLPQPNTIQVNGRGKVSTPPNLASLAFWVVGEGNTPDEASRALVARQKAVTAGLSGLLGQGTEITNSELLLLEVRGPECVNENRPRLSEGACAVTGHIARMQGNVRTTDIAKAGTAVGLARRLGARDARLQGFSLVDNRAPRQAAISRALTDAKAQAEALASAAGRRLGPILNVRDASYGGDEVVLGLSAARTIAPPPPPPPPPVEITLDPRPQETSAQVQVTFALEP